MHISPTDVFLAHTILGGLEVGSNMYYMPQGRGSRPQEAHSSQPETQRAMCS